MKQVYRNRQVGQGNESFLRERTTSATISGRAVRIGRVLFGVLLLGGLGAGTGIGLADDQPQELPKPTLRTTPPLFQDWNFESGSTDQVLQGFTIHAGDGTQEGSWTVEEDVSAPSRTHVMRQSLSCQGEECYHLLVANDLEGDYLDLSVRLKMMQEASPGFAGLAFSVQDARNFYAAVVHPPSKQVLVYAVEDGKPREIGKAEMILSDREWHSLRIQRYTIVSKEVIEVFFDNHMLLSLTDQSFGIGKLGLVAMGNGGFAFDNLRAMELLTQRPLSRPSAY
jgi:hypothetical protein